LFNYPFKILLNYSVFSRLTPKLVIHEYILKTASAVIVSFLILIPFFLLVNIYPDLLFSEGVSSAKEFRANLGDAATNKRREIALAAFKSFGKFKSFWC
jgi:hypothetical protein